MVRQHFSFQEERKKVEEGVKRWNVPTTGWHTSEFTCTDGSCCSQWCACTHNAAVIALPVWPLKTATEGHVFLQKSTMSVLYHIITVPGYILMITIFRNFLQPFSEQIPGRRFILLSKVISLSTLQRLYIFFPLPRVYKQKEAGSLFPLRESMAWSLKSPLLPRQTGQIHSPSISSLENSMPKLRSQYRWGEHLALPNQLILQLAYLERPKERCKKCCTQPPPLWLATKKNKSILAKNRTAAQWLVGLQKCVWQFLVN